jgi:excinuclease ABC subunit A
VNTLYILDEPSVGLHPRDSQRLVKILQELRAKENTVVVVERGGDHPRAVHRRPRPRRRRARRRDLTPAPIATAPRHALGRAVSDRPPAHRGAEQAAPIHNLELMIRSARGTPARRRRAASLGRFVCVTAASGSASRR